VGRAPKRRFYRRSGILPLIHPHRQTDLALVSLKKRLDHFDSVGFTRIRRNPPLAALPDTPLKNRSDRFDSVGFTQTRRDPLASPIILPEKSLGLL
jgi:hypothetical protein